MRRYFLTLIVLCVIAGSIAMILAEAKDLRCNPSDLSDEWYIAYCADGHHDHAAILFDIDGALDGARKADVIFLGNSTTQVAFSNVEVIQHFEAIGKRVFLLGFGYSEPWKFPAIVMARHNLTPRVLVINTTGRWMKNIVFTGREKYLIENPVEWFIRSYVHIAYQYLQHHYCAGGTDSVVCFREGGVLYRSRKNGTWKVGAPTGRYDAPPAERYFCKPNPTPGIPGPHPCASGHTLQPVPTDEEAPVDEVSSAEDDVATAQANTMKFLAAVKMPKECVVMIAAPSKLNERSKTRQVANAVGIKYIDVDWSGLYTTDGLHLYIESAEIYSRRLLAQLDPVIRRCDGLAKTSAEMEQPAHPR